MRDCRKMFRGYVVFPRANVRKSSESYEIIRCRNILLRESYARKKIKKQTKKEICEVHGGGRRAQGIAYSGKNSSL